MTIFITITIFIAKSQALDNIFSSSTFNLLRTVQLCSLTDKT